MSINDHEGTDALTRLAHEVEEERRTRGHTPFDATDDDDRQTGETRGDEVIRDDESSVDPAGDKMPPIQAFGH